MGRPFESARWHQVNFTQPFWWILNQKIKKISLLKESIAAASRLVKSESDGKRQIIQLLLACSYDRDPTAARLLHQADTAARQIERQANIPLVIASQLGPLSGLGVHNLVSRLTESPQIQTGVGFATMIIASSAALILTHERTQPQREQARQIRAQAMDEVNKKQSISFP